MKSNITITILAGDGIGPEVTRSARRILEAVLEIVGADYEIREALVGAAAIRATGKSLPAETLDLCAASDAVLLGAVGDPDFEPSGEDRPESALLELRRHFGLFANLRPIRPLPALAAASPMRPDVVRGVDLIIVRELTGGLYYGTRREATEDAPALDTMSYEPAEIDRIATVALRLAENRRCRVTSVDKANVLASMRQWRAVVEDTATRHPRVELSHQLVDSFALDLICDPGRFDVVLTPNMFGDILSDEAAALTGSLGVLPSASVGDGRFGLYEPVHGSAPDLAGTDAANPIGSVLSAALLLRHSLEMGYAAEWVEASVETALAAGYRTQDVASDPARVVGTEEFTDRILENLEDRYLDSQVPLMVV